MIRRHLRLLTGSGTSGRGRPWLPALARPAQSRHMDTTDRARLVTTDRDGSAVPFAHVIASVAAGDTRPDDWNLLIEPDKTEPTR